MFDTRRFSRAASLSARMALLAAALAGACPAVAAGQADRTLVIAEEAGPATLDPCFIRSDAALLDNIFDTLVGRDDTGRLVASVALDWEQTTPLVWTFHLRPGLRFQNGEPLDAAAVAFSLNRILDPALGSPNLSYIRTVAEVSAPGPLTVRIRTSAPDPLLPARMSRYPAYIVPPAYLRRVGNALFGRQPVGSGPYAVTDYAPDDHVDMIANNAYWRATPRIRRVSWRVVPQPTARIGALLTGEADLIDSVPVDAIGLIRRQRDLAIDGLPGSGLTLYLGLRTRQPPLNDVRVRRALSLAIDRSSIVRYILKGYATPTGTQVGPYDFGYQDVPAPAYDPAEARRLLAQAGYPHGFSIRMQVPRRYVKSAEIGQFIAQEFAAIGVAATLQIPDWSVYTQDVPAGRQAPIYMLAWGSTQTLDADAALYPILHSGEPYSQVDLPQLDTLLDAARTTMDTEIRRALYARIQTMVTEQVPLLTLYREDQVFAATRKLIFQPRPDGRIDVFDMAWAP
ncbi:ABC transporter substrate-binding protein [Acetobacteraceae bacterium KSS8]|uniref:ABC transporter substrate-binding protein n=1 Tax=Endosaccharibacter trunci TaxID=2812733 RepID=A0ABT1W6K9_9PROT|nr:ABC transporter substrate-binding protein [Acetobacteraceae bacterium KSS8]